MYSKQQIYDAIATVIDPEVGFDLVSMGLIYGAECSQSGDVTVTMTLSTRACPLHQLLISWVKDALSQNLIGIQQITINLVWEPAWNISMASQEVQNHLGKSIS